MYIISHRANLNGPNDPRENSPDLILEVLAMGFHVEVDVWYKDEKFFLGHDSPDYEIQLEFLANSQIWCHAKNVECLERLLSNESINCFFHDTDDVTLTSKNYMWTFPNRRLTKSSICVLPEIAEYSDSDLKICKGICTDYPIKYRERLKL